MIPVPTIEHFLLDTAATDGSDAERKGGVLADGADVRERCRGFCSLGIFWQALENEQLRRLLGLEDDDSTDHPVTAGSGLSGVLVRGVAPLAAANGFLRRDDVIVEIAHQKIANDGSFAVAPQERLALALTLMLTTTSNTTRLLVLDPFTSCHRSVFRSSTSSTCSSRARRSI